MNLDFNGTTATYGYLQQQPADQYQKESYYTEQAINDENGDDLIDGAEFE